MPREAGRVLNIARYMDHWLLVACEHAILVYDLRHNVQADMVWRNGIERLQQVVM